MQALPLRGKQAEFSATLEQKRLEVERALEYVELYGLYTECEAIYQVDNLMRCGRSLDAVDQAQFRFDPRAVDWPTYIHDDPPAVDRRPRPRQDHARQVAQHRPHGPAPQAGARSQAPRGRLRPREHADRLERRRELLVPRDAPAEHARADPLRAAHAGRGARAARSSIGADRSDFLRHFYRRYEDAPVDQIDEDAQRTADAADPHQELPRRHSPGARAPRRWPSHGADHRRARLRRRRPAAAVRRDRRRRDERAAGRHVLAAR